MNSNAIQEGGALLAQIRAYQNKISDLRPSEVNTESVTAAAKPFNARMVDAMMSSIDQVNTMQARSAEMISRYESGEDVPLTDVVLAMQKSSLAFEATLQVRNKIMKAYEDLLNMPV